MSRWSWYRAEGIGLYGRPKALGGDLKQEVEVCCYDGPGSAAIGKGYERLVDRGRARCTGTQDRCDCPPNLAIATRLIVKPALKHAEDDIKVADDEPLHFSSLLIGQARTVGLPLVASSRRQSLQDTVCRSIEFGVDVENKLTKIRKPSGPGNACTTNEQHFPARMSQQEPLWYRGQAITHRDDAIFTAHGRYPFEEKAAISIPPRLPINGTRICAGRLELLLDFRWQLAFRSLQRFAPLRSAVARFDVGEAEIKPG